jgi:hypothetical protein
MSDIMLSIHWDGTVRHMAKLKKQHSIGRAYSIVGIEKGTCKLTDCFHRILYLDALDSTNKHREISWIAP